MKRLGLATFSNPRWLGLAAALLLAACQAPAQITALATVGPAALDDTSQVTAPVSGKLGAERPSHVAPQSVPKAKINDDPTQVVGMLPGELESLLGRPEFVRRDSAAQVWQYRRPRCVLDLFLYGDEGRGPQVVYYEVRPLRYDAAGLSESAQRGCFAQLLLSSSNA